MTATLRGMLWEYADARGIVHQGATVRVHDYGGTDITHAMQSACGAYVMLSGARLRDARTLNRDAADAECSHAETADR